MKKSIPVFLRVSMYTALFFAVTAVGTGASAQSGATASARGSLYDLESKWRNTDDKAVSVAVAKGKPVVIAMVYTTCAHACPMIISQMQRIDKKFVEAGFKDMQYVLASFDVKRDRPDQLKKYREKRKLDPKKWHFLAAEREADARELSVALAISYKDLGNGDFAHSNKLTLLDPDGAVLGAVDNLNSDGQTLVDALKALHAKKN